MFRFLTKWRSLRAGACAQKPAQEIPWKLLLSKAPVWALIISHFCHNWGTFILLTWMPTYYNQVLPPSQRFAEVPVAWSNMCGMLMNVTCHMALPVSVDLLRIS